MMITSQLSSDILEAQFGPTTIKILHQDNEIRVIQTVAIEGGKVLELSLVCFLPGGAEAFPDAHKAVLAGESMGKAFRAAGIAFQRETQFAWRHAAPPVLGKYFGSQQPATVVAVRVLVGPNKMPYAQITETYAPTVAWPHLFGQPTQQTQADLDLLADYLITINN